MDGEVYGVKRGCLASGRLKHFSSRILRQPADIAFRFDFWLVMNMTRKSYLENKIFSLFIDIFL
jgi:hypothetical protein